MINRVRDYSNQIIGRLTVLKRVENSLDGHAQWKCRCTCGKIKVVLGKHLGNGHVVSCGCYNREQVIKAIKKANTVHGMTHTAEFYIWGGLLQRCYNKNSPAYAGYGGRGIKVCARWRKSFLNFLNDMGKRPSNKLQIDRIDNNKGYSPKNCRWVSASENCSNTRRNTFYTFKGVTKTLAQWAESIGVAPDTMWRRLKIRKWSLERAFTTKTLTAAQSGKLAALSRLKTKENYDKSTCS